MSDASPDPTLPEPTPPKPRTPRLASIDVYRGLVMFLMMAEVLHLSRVARALPESGFWAFLGHHQSHVPWVGCSLHDLIQPSFSFLVGVSMPFSIASRRARGQPEERLVLHAAWRALVLVALGIFLRSIGKQQTYFTFEDTLTQIGLGYGILFLLGLRSLRLQWIALAVILVGYWLAFALYPLPGPDFDWAAAGASATWEHNLSGFAAHWNKNTNLAWAFDTWFLNLFPRESPFTNNGGGYATLSFIPTLGTMLLGLIAGGWLKTVGSRRDRLARLLVAGVAGLAVGWLLDATGLCPNVKRIWTPSWTLFSGGWCFLTLAALHVALDGVALASVRLLAFPLVVIGMNSIAAYCMDWLFAGFIRRSLHTHLGEGVFHAFGPAYESLVEGGLILVVLWSILFWMKRRRIFLKI